MPSGALQSANVLGFRQSPDVVLTTGRPKRSGFQTVIAPAMTNRRLGSTSLAIPTRSDDSRNGVVFMPIRARRLADVETV